MTRNREQKEASIRVHTLGTKEFMGEPVYKRNLDMRAKRRATRKTHNSYFSGFRDIFR